MTCIISKFQIPGTISDIIISSKVFFESNWRQCRNEGSGIGVPTLVYYVKNEKKKTVFFFFWYCGRWILWVRRYSTSIIVRPFRRFRLSNANHVTPRLNSPIMYFTRRYPQFEMHSDLRHHLLIQCGLGCTTLIMTMPVNGTFYKDFGKLSASRKRTGQKQQKQRTKPKVP